MDRLQSAARRRISGAGRQTNEAEPRHGRPLSLGLALFALAVGQALSGQAPTVEGMVFDTQNGAPVAGADVRVLSVEASEPLAVGASDLAGYFRIDVSPGKYRLVISKQGYESSMETVEVELEGVEVLVALRRIDDGVLFEARSGLRGAAASLMGTLHDAQTGAAIEGAEVALRSAVDSVVATTDMNGFFVLDAGPEGSVHLEVRHLAYGVSRWPVDLKEGLSYDVSLAVAPEALELAGLTVVSQSAIQRRSAVARRMARGLGGHFLLRDALERRSYPPLYSALTSVPSAEVRSVDDSDPWNQRVYLRGCKAAIFVDGIEVFNPADDLDRRNHLGEFLRTPTLDIEAIEVYPGGATLPPEFNSPGVMCAVAIWTKRD